MDPDDREFMRQLLLWHEKATEAMIRRLDEGTARSRIETQRIRVEIEQIRARTEEIKRGVNELADAMRAHTREFVAEMQAQQQALFRVLDRLDGKRA
jgi:archaellum component FlaC